MPAQQNVHPHSAMISSYNGLSSQATGMIDLPATSTGMAGKDLMMPEGYSVLYDIASADNSRVHGSRKHHKKSRRTSKSRSATPDKRKHKKSHKKHHKHSRRHSASRKSSQRSMSASSSKRSHRSAKSVKKHHRKASN